MKLHDDWFLEFCLIITQSSPTGNGCELSGRGSVLNIAFQKPAPRTSFAYTAASPVRSSELLARFLCVNQSAILIIFSNSKWDVRLVCLKQHLQRIAISFDLFFHLLNSQPLS